MLVKSLKEVDKMLKVGRKFIKTLATRASSLPPSLPEPLGLQPKGSPMFGCDNIDEGDSDNDADMLCD